MRAIVSAAHSDEIDSGKRFGFGKNWASFLRSLTEDEWPRNNEFLFQRE
jgi:hypothetical protein